MIKTGRTLLLIALIAIAIGAAALNGSFSSQVSYEGEETALKEGSAYQVDVLYVHSRDSNAAVPVYGDLLTDDVFADSSRFCPNRTEILYLKLVNREAFPVACSLLMNVTENGFDDTLSYALWPGKDLLAEQKKEHPADWEAFLASSGAAPAHFAVTADGPMHAAADRLNLSPGETAHLALAVHMDADAGNEYQNKRLKVNFVLRVDADYEPGTIINGN